MLQSVKPSAHAAALTREDLIARAESLVPRLAARSAACEAQRKAPRETIEDYTELAREEVSSNPLSMFEKPPKTNGRSKKVS